MDLLSSLIFRSRYTVAASVIGFVLLVLVARCQALDGAWLLTVLRRRHGGVSQKGLDRRSLGVAIVLGIEVIPTTAFYTTLLIILLHTARFWLDA